MIKAVLLDLDDTLLVNSDLDFAKGYLGAAETYFQAQWGYQGISRVFIDIVQLLAGPRDMEQSNTARSLQHIQQKTGRPLHDIQHSLDHFYHSQYPQLQPIIQPIPSAEQLIQHLYKAGYAIVIATNPIYPFTAIQQRMEWAGLPDDESIYAFITHSDNMHFAKPNPAYYAEILTRIGIEPDEAIMVGNSLKNDIIPAKQLGLHTFHIQSGNQNTASGTLTQFYQQVVEENWLDTLTARHLSPEMIEPQYRGNIAAMFGLLDNVKPHHWNQHPDPDEWSILQILCHLLESESTVQRPRLQRIYQEENPFLASPKAPPGAQMPVCDDEGYRIARQFSQERQTTLRFLGTLSPEDWQRPARHSIFGLTTLLEMAHFTAQHDRLHLNQLCQTIGNCED